jgi:hypothetical protein
MRKHAKVWTQRLPQRKKFADRNGRYCYNFIKMNVIHQLLTISIVSLGQEEAATKVPVERISNNYYGRRTEDCGWGYLVASY